jgi:preprotein translocase subunit SecD
VLHNLFQFGFAGLAGIFVLAALLRRAHRGSFVMAAICAASAAVAAHYDVFWATATFGLGSVWALFTATNYIDLSWRAQTGMVIFLALGAGICIYPTYYDETHAKAPAPTEQSKEDLEQKVARDCHGDNGLGHYLRCNIPFRMVRGLDLKGGLRLVYTVDVEEAIKDRRDRDYDELRGALTTALGFHSGDSAPTVEELAKLPTKVQVAKSKTQAGVITVVFNTAEDAAKIDDKFLDHFLKELQLVHSPDGLTMTFRIRSDREQEIRDHAVTQARDTVQRRIDGLGVKEASLTVRDDDLNIEVPGDDEKQFAEIRELIGQVARLEFKMVDDNVDFFEAKAAGKGEELPKGLVFPIENAPVGTSGPGGTGDTKQKANHYARLTKGEREDMPSALKRLKEWTSTLNVDPDHEIGYEKIQEPVEQTDGSLAFEDVGWRTFYLFSKAEITGDLVRDADAMYDDQGRGGMGGWHVRMQLTSIGGDRFEDITARNIKRRFAIILDGKVESAPVIQTKIPGGVATITMGAGNPDQQLAESQKLTNVLKSGALPAPISHASEQRLGATLGADAIVQGGKGALAGISLVLVFMVVYYSRAGMIANICVLFNLVLQVAILAMIGASMTLPGIAGLVLTVGIAVDANVLINERIREELRHGKSPRAAVDIGYDKAFSAIIDGHATTLLSGIILWQLGTGPIKGFAVTLFIGVLASLFTGVVCTRLMFDWAVRARKVKDLHLGQH